MSTLPYLILGAVVAVLLIVFTATAFRWGSGRPEMPVKLMVVLGSGGHTAEMLTLVGHLDKGRYSPRCYVVAETDRMGAQKAWTSEGLDPLAKKNHSGAAAAQVSVRTIPRSREVGQSYITSVATTLRALLAAVRIVYVEAPGLVLVNGPGTCIPICAAALLFRTLGIGRAGIVYVESIARTSSLSLSGKLLYHLRMADGFFVQWPQLQKRFPRSQYAGRLY